MILVKLLEKLMKTRCQDLDPAEFFKPLLVTTSALKEEAMYQIEWYPFSGFVESV